MAPDKCPTCGQKDAFLTMSQPSPPSPDTPAPSARPAAPGLPAVAPDGPGPAARPGPLAGLLVADFSCCWAISVRM